MQGGYSAPLLAYYNGHMAVVELLLSKGAHFNVNDEVR